jgi:hypothetical protein
MKRWLIQLKTAASVVSDAISSKASMAASQCARHRLAKFGGVRSTALVRREAGAFGVDPCEGALQPLGGGAHTQVLMFRPAMSGAVP